MKLCAERCPLFVPFKFFVLAATGGDVDRVIVDGRTIVDA
tara:strand:- start:370 stop:489 length:120 start_codon:yes stop_codon:yes gene_type:complete